MRFHYAGKYSGDESTLPQREHPAGSVPFREPQDMKRMALALNGASLGLLVLLLGVLWLRKGGFTLNLAGWLLSLACLIPHEFLHALWFREDVYLYQNLRQGMLFVVGPEDMDKGRFIAMSLCPNVVFGLIPFLLFLVRPDWELLGSLGALSLAMGVGDYMNVWNAARQVPSGAVTYLSGMHSFWCRPEGSVPQK